MNKRWTYRGSAASIAVASALAFMALGPITSPASAADNPCVAVGMGHTGCVIDPAATTVVATGTATPLYGALPSQVTIKLWNWNTDTTIVICSGLGACSGNVPNSWHNSADVTAVLLDSANPSATVTLEVGGVAAKVKT